MKELFCQINQSCPACNHRIGEYFLPYSDEDRESAKEFKVNQIVKNKVYGATKERSLVQLHTYWQVCKYIAQLLSDHEVQHTKDDIDFEVKIQVAKKHPSMIRRFKSVSGIVYMEPISISFANMKHIQACDYFNLAFKEMEKMTQIDKDLLIEQAKEQIGR